MALRYICRNSNEESGGCTCRGGPYTHGPEGLTEVLAELKRRKEEENADTPVREARPSGA